MTYPAADNDVNYPDWDKYGGAPAPVRSANPGRDGSPHKPKKRGRAESSWWRDPLVETIANILCSVVEGFFKLWF